MIIHKIPAKRELRKMRVAAYARVSTNTDEQAESFETQVDYYTWFIKQNDNWEFAGVYADQGKTGTNAKLRPEFQRMMADARNRKFDILLVKAISRFARNVVDAQEYVHELKKYDVEVRFESERISSADPASELMFNMLAATAQEESRNKSEHVKWSYRKLAEKGVRHLGNNRVLGYDEVDGKLTPNGDAWIVKMIFEQYAAGMSLSQIVKNLEKAGAKRLHSEKGFSVSSVQRILSTEIYVGDRLLQKDAPHNYLTKRPDPNIPFQSRYIKDDHEGIVAREIWDQVKARQERENDERANGVYRRENTHFLYGRVFCAECGSVYKRRTVKGKDGLQKVWKCAERQKGSRGNGCRCEIITEENLLRLISDKLGLAWTDAEHFDVNFFLSKVKSVTVSKDEVCVLENTAA